MFTLSTESPAGTLISIVDGDGVVHAAGFTTPDVLADRMGVDVPARWDGPPSDAPARTAATIDRYVAGDLMALTDLRWDQPGTLFQQLVWDALGDVPAGATATYAELAAAIKRPNAVRAVGSACGRNRIAPFVPCHRAVRSDGTLGGYLYGLEIKGWLLEHEAGHD